MSGVGQSLSLFFTYGRDWFDGEAVYGIKSENKKDIEARAHISEWFQKHSSPGS